MKPIQGIHTQLRKNLRDVRLPSHGDVSSPFGETSVRMGRAQFDGVYWGPDSEELAEALCK